MYKPQLKPQLKPMISSQQGATLIVGLVIMALLTVVGISVMNVTTIDVKVMANAKDRQLAFNGAESALFNGGQEIQDTYGSLDVTATGFVGDTYALTTDWWSNEGNWSLAAVSNSPASSQFIIEVPFVDRARSASGIKNLGLGSQGPATMHGFYPTTARSKGPGKAFVVLQSHFVKRLYDAVVK
jgi:Tfp pilus assembly protein PilX